MFARTLIAESPTEMLMFGIMFAALFIGYRVLLFYLDRNNIRTAATRNGWTNITVKWTPFALGWLFENGERHYRVYYRDQHGKTAWRDCKTGILTGVFWRNP